MYTFNPIPPIQPDHTGFVLVCVFCVLLLLVCLVSEPRAFFVWFFASTILCGFAYCVSYVWTNQEIKPYTNEQVKAELVGFQPEGYNERSGKTRADRHYMYVVYSINGEKVILKATEGITYPQTAILYKN